MEDLNGPQKDIKLLIGSRKTYNTIEPSIKDHQTYLSGLYTEQMQFFSA